MATEAQFIKTHCGGRPRVSKHLTITMAAGAQADVTTDDLIPAGSTDVVFRWSNTTAFTGSPTNINLSIGKTAPASGTQDQSYVANTDVKGASGWANLTQATGSVADLQSWPSGQAIHGTLTANGGTNPAGTVLVQIEYTPPDSVL